MSNSWTITVERLALGKDLAVVVDTMNRGEDLSRYHFILDIKTQGDVAPTWTYIYIYAGKDQNNLIELFNIRTVGTLSYRGFAFFGKDLKTKFGIQTTDDFFRLIGAENSNSFLLCAKIKCV